MPEPPKSGNEYMPSRRRILLIIILLCVVSGTFAYLGFDNYPGTSGDNAEFVILARSLARGRGFSYINHPEERPATKYPPGFPLLLAGWSKLLGDTFMSFKLVSVLTYVGAVVVAFILGRRLIGDGPAVISALMVASSTTFIKYSHAVLSEMPYALVSLLVLYVVLCRPHNRRNFALVVILCISAYYLRTVGGTLVLAVAVYYFLTSRKKHAVIVVSALLIAAAAWALRNYAAAGEGSRYLSVMLKVDPYLPHKGDIGFVGLIVRMGKNLVGYSAEHIAYTVLPSYHVYTAFVKTSAARVTICLVVLLLAALGGYELRRRAKLVNIYLLLYMLAYLIWPDIWMSSRFMVPIAPIIAIYVVSGIYKLCSIFEFGRRAALVFSIAVLLTNAYALALYVERPRGFPDLWANYIQCAVWCAHNTPEDAVFVCRKPFFFNIFSRRRTISYPFTKDRQEMKDYLAEWDPDYVIVDYFGGSTGTTELYILPVLLDMIGSVKTVYATGEPVNMVVKLNVDEEEAAN